MPAPMKALLRFLDVVRRELEADDVRGELGGRDPGPDVVWGKMPGGIRVVAVFDTPPADLEPKRVKLRALLDSFASLGTREEATPPPPPRVGAGHELDDALDLLAQRARALGALVIDDASPVIWGSSMVPHGPEDVDEAIWVARVLGAVEALGLDPLALVERASEEIRPALVQAGASDAAALARDVERVRELGPRVLDRAHLLAMRAVAAVRASEATRADEAGDAGSSPDLRAEGEHALVRSFANIYRVVLVFGAPFSELHAEAALIHALPVIERLVTSLPPRDPDTGGAKVAVLRRLRRV